MKISAVITLSYVVLFRSAFTAPTSDAANSGVYYPMFWIGSVTPGGPEIRLEGTAKDIVYQLQELNPEWEPASATDKEPTSAALMARYFKGRPTCNLVSGTVARSAAIERGVAYLRSLGTGNCGAHAHSCSRVSCSENSGIELCNDRNEEIHVACNRIGDAAEEIRYDCYYLDELNARKVKGQWFDTTGYNIVVRGATC